MAVDGSAEIVHHALAHEIREVRLPDARHAADDGDPDEPEDERCEQLAVLVRDGDVEDRAKQEGRHHAEGRRAEDEPEDEHEPAAVGTEQAGDTSQVLAANLRISRALSEPRVGATA